MPILRPKLVAKLNRSFKLFSRHVQPKKTTKNIYNLRRKCGVLLRKVSCLCAFVSDECLETDYNYTKQQYRHWAQKYIVNINQIIKFNSQARTHNEIELATDD